MTEKQKLIIAMMQMNNLTHLLEGNEYEEYLYRHIVNINTELKRQLSHHRQL